MYFLLLLFFQTLGFQSQPDISTLYWLKGNWEFTKGDKTFYENWTTTESGSLIGDSFLVEGSDTVFTETMRIAIEAGVLFYEADVAENPAPVRFTITSATPHDFIAQNPDHDFPQFIQYAKEGDLIVARVSNADRELIFKFSPRF